MDARSKCKYSPNRKRKLTNRRDGIVTYLYIFFRCCLSLVPFIKKIDMCNKEYNVGWKAMHSNELTKIIFYFFFRLHTFLIVYGLIWIGNKRKLTKQKRNKNSSDHWIWLMNQNRISGVNEIQFFFFLRKSKMKWRGVSQAAKYFFLL